MLPPQIIKQERIDCGYRELDGYIIPDNSPSANFGSELRAMHNAGLREAAQVHAVSISCLSWEYLRTHDYVLESMM